MDFQLFFLQATTVDISASSAPAAQQVTSVWDAVIYSGFVGLAIYVAMVLLSVFSVYMTVTKFLELKKAIKDESKLQRSVKEAIKMGNIATAKSLCQTENTILSRLLFRGLDRIGKEFKDIKVSIENGADIETAKLEKGIAHLATISGAAPMLGFLGTVIGMIQSFQQMATITTGSISPGLLAGGIFTALITTAVGLIIGIFSFVAFNSLNSMVSETVSKLQSSILEFMDTLQQ